MELFYRASSFYIIMIERGTYYTKNVKNLKTNIIIEWVYIYKSIIIK